MDSILLDYAWSGSKLNEAIEVLSRKIGFISKVSRDVPAPPQGLENQKPELISKWLDSASKSLGVESSPVESGYADLRDMIANIGPGLIRIPDRNIPKFLAIVKAGKNKVKVITPELKIRKVPIEWIRSKLCQNIETPLVSHISVLLKELEVPDKRRDQVATGLLEEQLSAIRITNCWMIKTSPSENPWKQIVKEGFFLHLFGMLCSNLVITGLGIGSWAVIGYAALNGKFQWPWLLAWGLILFTVIPFQLMMTWFSSKITITMGYIFKERLLFGILNLNPEDVRHEGAGQFMGRVMESEAIQNMALSGGLKIILAFIQLLAATCLFISSQLWYFNIVLLAWGCVASFFIIRYFIQRKEFAIVYRSLTNDLVERMVGHRTRLAQEPKSQWHKQEDQILARYLAIAQKMDQTAIILQAMLPKGWLLIGLGTFAYAFVTGPSSIVTLGIALGGVMLAASAFEILSDGSRGVAELVVAWSQFSPIFKAGKNSDQTGCATPIPVSTVRKETGDKKSKTPILHAKDIVFQYRDFGKPVLENCNFQIHEGDRILLEGKSGGGKSTLASIIANLREQKSGLLLLNGMDRKTIGNEEWRQQVAMTPQFHENHTFCETFSFNLLMGRNWPPSKEDLEEAEKICTELGLDDVLRRMPSGFQQIIGESGWRLSHGEKSRLYIARSLLQKSSLIILDESFAALDPENLEKTLECVFKRASTLLVIAHP